MGKLQRVKGAAGEREWCAKLAEHGFKAKRLLGQARDGGGDVPCPPILYEVKRRWKIATYQWLTQCEVALASKEKEYDGCKFPAVAMRGDDRQWLMVMNADDLLPILASFGFGRTAG